MPRRALLIGLLLAAAFGGGVVALLAERTVVALLPRATPTTTPTGTPPPTPLPVVVIAPTVAATARATPLPGDEMSQQLSQLQSQVAQQEGLILVAAAEDHLTLATESLVQNDLVVVNQELVAAHAALDRAFDRVGEDLKQVIDNQRREMGRVRTDLYLAPEGLDLRLRAMRDQLLALTIP